MKCRACWAEAAEVWRPGGWRGVLAGCLLLSPVKCHHCLHRSFVPRWLVGRSTVHSGGKTISLDPPSDESSYRPAWRNAA
jgi:hypothetical protein